MRILIVENNYEVNKLYEIEFKELGYANDIVKTVEDGKYITTCNYICNYWYNYDDI